MSRKNAVLHFPKFFVNASAGMFAVGKKVNVKRLTLEGSVVLWQNASSCRGSLSVY